MGKRWALILATGFGSGYSPFAPGTAGSLVGVLLFLLFGWYSLSANLVFLVFLFFFGVYVCGVSEKSFRRHDAKEIVLDEIHGMYLVLSFMPSPTYWLPAFLVFRAMDILKPYPANIFDRKVKGGWGIMLDDLVAAIYAVLILKAFYWWLQ